MYKEDFEYTEVETTIVSEEEVMQQKQPKKKGPGKDFLKVTIYAAVFGLIGGVSFQGFNLASDKLRSVNSVVEEKAEIEQEDSETKVEAVKTSASEENASSGVSAIVDSVMPSIVSINSTYKQAANVFGRSYENESQGSGSGIIIGQNKSEVLVVTNNHVVEGANAVEVVFSDEKTVTATVKGTDASSDLAVLAVKMSDMKEDTKNMIRVANLGDSKEVKVGEMAIAIGNALGYGQSVTVGYISAKERQVAMEDSTMKLIQTDAAINPGNSGGALLNASGQVIGINSIKYASEEVEGMGYAIPISDALPIVNELMNREEVPTDEQAYLGVRGQDVTEEYAERFNMPVGIYIGEVSKGSPAEKAGLTATSIITEINGRKVETFEQMQSVLTHKRAGEEAVITVQVFENGKYAEKEVKVTLGSRAEIQE